MYRGRGREGRGRGREGRGRGRGREGRGREGRGRGGRGRGGRGGDAEELAHEDGELVDDEEYLQVVLDEVFNNKFKTCKW